jgi:hypothetical protein
MQAPHGGDTEVNLGAWCEPDQWAPRASDPGNIEKRKGVEWAARGTLQMGRSLGSRPCQASIFSFYHFYFNFRYPNKIQTPILNFKFPKYHS